MQRTNAVVRVSDKHLVAALLTSDAKTLAKLGYSEDVPVQIGNRWYECDIVAALTDGDTVTDVYLRCFDDDDMVIYVAARREAKAEETTPFEPLQVYLRHPVQEYLLTNRGLVFAFGD